MGVEALSIHLCGVIGFSTYRAVAAGEYETLERLQKDYNELQGVELCS